VDISGADDDAGGASAGHGLLHGGAVLSAGGEDGALELDFGFGGGVFEFVDERGVGDEAGVHDVESDALALLVGHFFFGDTGGVAGEGDVESDADVGLHGVGGGFGAAEADLFLDGEGADDLAVVGGVAFVELADGLDGDPAGEAVVECFGDDLVADLDEGFVHDDEVADAEGFFGPFGVEAGVDEELFDFGDFLAFVGAGDVDGSAAGVHDAFVVAVFGDDEDAA